MTTADMLLTITVLIGVGLWLLLPRGTARGRFLGLVLVLCALGFLGGQLRPLGEWVRDATFLIMAGVTLIAAVGAISMRSPVYCALWFALSVLGTAGLFLFNGAQFLGVATVVVYAGAIVVTFLFVLMLAQPEGHAYYDQLSWEAPLSAGTGALMVAVLTMTISSSFASSGNLHSGGAAPTPAEMREGILADQHVAQLGARLFSEHLIAVEVTGLLLMIALIAATAIISYGRPKNELPEQSSVPRPVDGGQTP